MKDIHVNRLLNVVLYILKDFRNGVDYIKLYKIIYFAHRKYLAETGLPLVHDTLKAWKYGPVPSFTGSLVKRLENRESLPPDMTVFKGKLRVNSRKKIFGKTMPSSDSLNATATRILDETIGLWKMTDSKKLSDISHNDLSWQEAYERHRQNEKSPVMKPLKIAKDGNASDNVLKFVKDYYTISKEFYNFRTRPEITARLDAIASTLTEFLHLEENWDGEDSSRINPLSTLNCRRFIARRCARIELVSYVYPTPWGNVCVDWESNGSKVSCEFGPRQIAFYFQSADRSEVFDSPSLSADKEGFTLLSSYIERLP